MAAAKERFVRHCLKKTQAQNNNAAARPNVRGADRTESLVRTDPDMVWEAAKLTTPTASASPMANLRLRLG